MPKKTKGLGRGLGALLEVTSEENENTNVTEEKTVKDEPKKKTASEKKGPVTEADILDIDVNKAQPRKDFDKDELAELAESIKSHGMIQPIVVKKTEDRYLIIAGERRFRAAMAAGLKKVPITVKEVDDKEVLELSLIENIQRADLNPVEEAMAIRALMDDYGYTQEEASKRLSKSRSAVANSLRLLALDEEMLSALRDGVITSGHARAILMGDTEEDRKKIFEAVVLKQLSVREAEEFARNINKVTPPRKTAEKTAEILSAERELSERLDAKVRISGSEKKGRLYIEYGSAEQLQAIYEYLTK